MISFCYRREKARQKAAEEKARKEKLAALSADIKADNKQQWYQQNQRKQALANTARLVRNCLFDK